MRKPLLFICLQFLYSFLSAQTLKPGFDPKEYLNVLSISFGKYDSIAKLKGGVPEYKRIYRSPVKGLDNRWDLWQSSDTKTTLINIRGTIASTPSWLANIYSAMVPAKGTVQFNDSTSFSYQLATDSTATVHVGWLLSLGSIVGDMEQKIKDQYAKGVKDFILSGHSQGAGITFLVRSYLYYRTKEGALPADITYKTYCSAAPKPGNLQYVYDYDFINKGGWSFTVVNAADWVPETPYSIQKLNDINPMNPFVNIKSVLKKQKYFVRLYARGVYNKMNRSTRKAAQRYEKYLGKKVGKQVRKIWPQLKHPGFAHTMNYSRAGTPIILLPDAAYYERFPNDAGKGYGIWKHHVFEAYWLLTEKQYLNQ